MKKTFVQFFILLLVSVVFAAGEQPLFSKHKMPSKTSSKQISKPEKTSRTRAAVDDKIQTLPLLFEKNQGQFDKTIKYLSRVKNFNLALNSDEVIYQMPAPNCEAGRRQDTTGRNRKTCKTFLLKMKIIGANSDAVMHGFDESVTTTGYSIGSDQTKWLNDIPNYEGVRYQNIYQGINLVFRGTEQKLEYDFHISPNADTSLIRLKFDGAKNFLINAQGELVFKFKDLELKHQKPFAYQIIDGQKVAISAGYVLLGKNRIGFKVGDYDRTKELIIDPLVYASYLGGTAGGDVIDDIAVDPQGSIYTASDARFTVFRDNVEYTYSDIMISKFNPDGTQRLWVKFVGGSQDDVPYGMDVDNSGRVYVTGVTFSPDFPRNFAEQNTHPISRIDYDFTGFVFQLGSNGEISYSTYLGGSTPNEYGESIVADSDANAYVTGYTCSSNFPTRNGFQNSLQGSCNAFLTKYDFFGHISYSTLFGGSNSIGADVFTDGSGIAYVSGGTNNGIYTTSGAYSTTGNGFVAKFDTNQTGSNSLIYSTRIPKQGAAIAVDRSGNAWIAMSSLGFLTSQSAQVIRLNNLGSALLVGAQTFGNQIRDIAVDGNGSAYFAYNFYANNNIAAKVIALRPSGEEIDSHTIDATRDERAFGITLGPEPDIVYVGGHTTSLDFPTTPGAYQPTSYAPNIFFGQGFFAKVRLNVPQQRSPLIFIPGVGGSTLYEADVTGNPIENLWMDGLTQVLPYPTQKLSKLSLNPDDVPFNYVVPVDAVRDLRIAGRNVFEVYGEFLENLRTQGNYIPRIGCSTQQSGETPTLFIFPYDWRLSNANSAAKLKDLIDCVHSLYPAKKVDILTHSMGGLVARRYIVNHPNNHHVNKWISMVAPWLGAAKALDSIYTGRFVGKFETGGGIYLYQNSVKNIVQFGKGPQELLPSAWYFINGGKPFAYQSSVNASPIEYSYTQTYEIINSVFPSQPYINTADFHNTPGQDNWESDSSGIKYYHFFGKQKCPNTIGQFIIRPRTSFPISIRKLRFGSENKYTDGDGTVPIISANRPFGMLAPNTTIRAYSSPNCEDDENYDHNGILGNEQFRAEILGTLNDNSAQQFVAKVNDSKLMNATTENFNPEDLMNYLSITGVDKLDISDDQGNTTIPLGIADIGIQGISYEFGSSAGDSLEIPHEVVFSAGKAVNIKFRATTEKIGIENFRGFGRENVTEAIKYLDLQFPVGVTAWLKFTANGLENLRYDVDGDGVFETEIQPTFHLTSSNANDRTPPDIDISFSVINNTAAITVNAIDNETGINQIRYIVNGETSDHIYSAPFMVDLTQSKLLYVSAEDNAGNRNLLAKWLDVSSPSTTIIQTPAPNQNGWSKEDVSVGIKSLDDLGGSGVQWLTYSGSGAQTFLEETLSVKEIPFTFPSPSTASDFLAKSLLVSTEGVTNLTFFAKDKAGIVETTKTVAVKIDKTAPETTGNYSQNGNQMIIDLTSNDALSGVDRILFSVDSGNLQTYTAPFPVLGSGNHNVAFFATDKAGNIEEIKTLSFTIVVINPEVVINSPTSGTVYPVGTTVDFDGNFSGDRCSSHTAVWTFDSISQTGTVNESNGTVTATHTFSSAGIYPITLTVNNGCGGTGSATTVDGLAAMVVVYEADGGFVTGGGWIDSPLGAYTPNPNLTGRVSFGFNSKYQRGATVPTGNTEFQFRAADFNFKSTSYDWLVVGGAKAQFKGSGTINNTGNYGFLLTAIDGQINGGQDKFRIKIWDKSTGNVIYDNQFGSSDNETPATIIGGGSIIIHRQ
jgi:triacylglycerol esterase/lipase EstA (alpha/beta hydrolase family)